MATFQNRSTAADVSLRTERVVASPDADACERSGASPETNAVNEIPPTATPDVEAALAAEALMELESNLGEPL